MSIANQVRKEVQSIREQAVPELLKVRDSAQIAAKLTRLRESIAAGVAKSGEICRVWQSHAATQFRKLKRPRPATPATQVEIAKKAPRESFKLRIRLTGLPLRVRLAFARTKLEWKLKRESMSRDSRLWSSLVLGAFAALVVTGLFSMSRHFAQTSLPSNRVSASSAPEMTSASAAPVVLLPLRPVATSPKPAFKKVSAKAKPQQANLRKPKTKTAARPKIHRNPDEDYVAKDTYVYYGKRATR